MVATSLVALLAGLALVEPTFARQPLPNHRRHLAKRASDKIFTGLAYWGAQKNTAGACGETHEDSYPLIGISHDIYSDASCDRWVQILNGANNKSIVVPVKDSCSTCSQSDVYLSPGAFEKLADLETGVLQVAWTFVAKPKKTANLKAPTSSSDESVFATVTQVAHKAAAPVAETTKTAAISKKVPTPAVAEVNNEQETARVVAKPVVKPTTTKAAQPTTTTAAQPTTTTAPKTTTLAQVKAATKVAVSSAAPTKESSTTKYTGSLLLGLPWAVDNTWSTVFSGSRIKFYHHWQDSIVPEMPSDIDFWPTFYDRSSLSAFQAQIAAQPNPKVILGHNEPDLSTQGYSTVANAVEDYQTHLSKLAGSGTQLCAPSIAYDLEGWLKPFMAQCTDCKISCLSLHSYDDYDPNASMFKSRIQKAHAAFPDLPIYVTEFGLTASSGPSAAQAQSYLASIIQWAESTSYVKGLAWFGAWAENPDGFAATVERMFDGPSSLTPLGQFYAFGN